MVALVCLPELEGVEHLGMESLLMEIKGAEDWQAFQWKVEVHPEPFQDMWV